MWTFLRPDATMVLRDKKARESLARYFDVMQDDKPAKFTIKKTPSKLQPTSPTKQAVATPRPPHRGIRQSRKGNRHPQKNPTRPTHTKTIVPRPQNRNSKPHSRKLPPLHTPMPQRPPQRRTRILQMRNPDHRLNNVPTHGRRARTRPVRNHIHPRLHAQVPPLPKLEHIPMVRERRDIHTQATSQSR